MRQVPTRDEVERLLLAVTGVEQQSGDLATRRLAILEEIARIASAQAGFWGWGRGHPMDSTIAPVVGLPFGFTPSEWAVIMEASLDEDGRAMSGEPIADLLKTSPQVTAARSTFWTDEQWHSTPSFQRHLAPIGWDDWLTSVRYLSDDTWCCLTLWRRAGRPPFGPGEIAFLDLALAGTRWLHPKISEAIPPQAFVDLTPRQRMVMTYLLDGLSRKQIAAILGVSFHTINDHVKSLYERFEVNSATELAARFLKAR